MIGMAAYEEIGGLILGIVMHLFVSIVPALAYGLIAWRLSATNRLAWVSGPMLGVLVFFFMGLVVLPHSVITMLPHH